jgi:acyl-coenzyme A thioesterase PaaI-like protein
MQAILTKIIDQLPESKRETAKIWLFGFFKIPMLFWLRPKVIEMSDKRCVVYMPLNRRSKNHLNSMYFAALAAGADCAAGFMAMMLIQKSGHKVSLSFKDFHADFHKRAESGVYFTCDQGEEIQAFVEQVLESGERMNLPVRVQATCPDKLGDEPVVDFTLTLSLKKKS